MQNVERLRRAAQLLSGLGICGTLAILSLYSSFQLPWEPQNLDGSSDITWRSGIALLLLSAISLWISFWLFRKRVTPPVLLGLALCLVSGRILLDLLRGTGRSGPPK